MVGETRTKAAMAQILKVERQFIIAERLLKEAEEALVERDDRRRLLSEKGFHDKSFVDRYNQNACPACGKDLVIDRGIYKFCSFCGREWRACDVIILAQGKTCKIRKFSVPADKLRRDEDKTYDSLFAFIVPK